MPLKIENGAVTRFELEKVGVIGPGIVGMPMAAMLAHAQIREGTTDNAEVVVVQRKSASSGWKVDEINAGRSPIGGVEPELDRIVAEAVARGDLRATHDVAELGDADLVLVCVQTDKDGIEPAYGPLMSAIDGLCTALQHRPKDNVPIIVFESTLAPSSMETVVRERFASHGLVEGRDVLLGNSPNRVMPGRLVERIRSSDKLAAGLRPETLELIGRIYDRIVPEGRLHRTTSLTAEIVKTLENAYRDVRIAYAAEIARYCDAGGIDFHALRRVVNQRIGRADQASEDPGAVPVGGLLVPTIGVGGHCLPKDGILLWWRLLEAGVDTSRSLILRARTINDASPAHLLALAEKRWGPVHGHVALLGAAYRGDADDTRNSPTFTLANELAARRCTFTIHDPHVRTTDPNLLHLGLVEHFTQDLSAALDGADHVVFCTPHAQYSDRLGEIVASTDARLIDGCNLFVEPDGEIRGRYTGIGKGETEPTDELVDFVLRGFRAVEVGVANELDEVISFLNERYPGFRPVDPAEVRRLAATCATGCDIVEAGPVERIEPHDGFMPSLVATASGIA